MKPLFNDSHGHRWKKTADSTVRAAFYICKKCGIGGFGSPQASATMIIIGRMYDGLTCDEAQIFQVMES